MQETGRQDMTDYKQPVFDNVYGFDDWIWAGLRSYPWVEFGSLVERKQGCIIVVLVHGKQEADWPQNWTANSSHQIRNYGHGAPGFSRVDHLWSMQCGEALTFSSFWVVCE
jgi:hypothetical protein